MAKARAVSQSTFLRAVPIFGGLEGHSLDRVVDVLQERTFRAGTVIFNEGELGREMYVLREGEVEIQRESSSGKPVPIVRLGPGETFGEMTLVELQPRSATVVATKAVKTLSLTNLDLYNLYRDDNYAYVIVLQNICRMLSRRLRKADGRICEFLSPAKAGAKGSSRAKPKLKRARSR
ncbi:MAG: cyclic nucleotide-binding domain-containing protein [Myxococcaceae bacterium]